MSKTKYGYAGPDEFRPLTAWNYVGYGLLFGIPVLGFFFLLFFTFNSKNIPRRSFARSYWCWLLLILFLVFFLILILIYVPETVAYLKLLFSYVHLANLLSAS